MQQSTIKPIQLEQFKQEALKYVDSEDQIPDFHFEDVVGVDLEQSKNIGYAGQICLLQLKLGPEVIIFDILTLKNSKKLNDWLKNIFEDPRTVKVFYGGQQDLYWLQRDLNLRVENYCDLREIATAVPKLVDKSLINLWSHYCQYNFEKNQKKDFQESDWFKRPLHPEQIKYAAMDAFYLPYIRQQLLLEADPNDLLIAKKRMIEQTKKPYIPDKKSAQHFMEVYQKKQKQKNHYNNHSLLKYIFCQLQLLKQDKCAQENFPLRSWETDEELIEHLNTLINFKNLPQIETYQQFGQVSEEVEDKTFKSLKDPDQLSQEWKVIKQKYLIGIYDQLLGQPETIQYCLNQIYKVESFKDQQKEAEKIRRQVKQERFLKFQEKYTTKKQVYGGARISAPDGTCLCACDMKKAEWYLKNELADLITEDPFHIMLRFQPSALENIDDKEKEMNQFYTASRENQCVVCGAKQNYMKYNIVPVVYKKFLPNEYKSHRSHDVVLLCVRCHEKASASIEHLKHQLAIKYNSPVVQLNETQQLLENIKSLKRVALLIQNNKDKDQETMNEARKNLQTLFEKIYSVKQVKESSKIDHSLIGQDDEGQYIINDKFLDLCIRLKDHSDSFIEASRRQMKTYSHGQQVVEQLKNDQEIEEFIRMWRNHFVHQLNPQFLAPGWSVDHKFKRAFGERSKFNGKVQQAEN